MILRIPHYYRNFKCSADKCSDSCCIGWEIDLDEDTYDYYSQIPGEFGDYLRSKITDGEEKSFILNGERCPFLNEQNLCEIYTELGETALCEICTEYPRFTLEYADVREKCLGLSCEEAGKLVLLSEELFSYEEFSIPEMFDAQGEAACESEFTPAEKQFVNTLELVRDKSIVLLQKRTMPVEERLCLLLLMCSEIQESLELNQFDEIVQTIKKYDDLEYRRIRLVSYKDKKGIQKQFVERIRIFHELEVLGEEWSQTLLKVEKEFSVEEGKEQHYRLSLENYWNYIKEREYEWEQLLVYFTFRYFMKTVYDGDVLGKAKFVAVAFLMIRDMDTQRYISQNETFTQQDRVDTARIYSKEVEHSEENLKYLAEAFGQESVFETGEMIKQILV